MINGYEMSKNLFVNATGIFFFFFNNPLLYRTQHDM